MAKSNWPAMLAALGTAQQALDKAITDVLIECLKQYRDHSFGTAKTQDVLRKLDEIGSGELADVKSVLNKYTGIRYRYEKQGDAEDDSDMFMCCSHNKEQFNKNEKENGTLNETIERLESEGFAAFKPKPVKRKRKTKKASNKNASTDNSPAETKSALNNLMNSEGKVDKIGDALIALGELARDDSLSEDDVISAINAAKQKMLAIKHKVASLNQKPNPKAA